MRAQQFPEPEPALRLGQIQASTREGDMFVVRVADNFHYMEEDETMTHGRFETWPEAIAAARMIVDRCLAGYHLPGMTAEELFSQYSSFGDDPHVSPVPDGECLFSAWTYARERCAVLCD